MRAQMRGRIGRQSACSHRGSEVRTADADVDDVGHGLAQRAAKAALANVCGEREHFRAHRGDLGRDVLSIDENRLFGEIAQRGMQRRAFFGRIHDVAAKHRVALGFDLSRLGQGNQQRNRRCVDSLFGIIEEKIVENDVKPSEARRIVGEFPRNRRGKTLVPMGLQLRHCL